MIITVQVGDLIIPLVCKRCGRRELVIVGDEASEQRAEANLAAHACVPREKEKAS